MTLEELDDLEAVLRSFTAEEVAALQAGVKRYHRYFIWEEEAGGKAYDLVLMSLRKKLYNLQARFVR